MNTQSGNHHLGGPGAEGNYRFKCSGNPDHGACYDAGRLFRNSDGNPLGYQFPDNQRKIGNQRHDNKQRQAAGIRTHRGKLFQKSGYRSGQGCSGKHTGKDTDGRNTYLNSGKKFFCVMGNFQRCQRILISVLCQFCQFGLSGPHNGDFRQGTESVRQHKKNQYQ